MTHTKQREALNDMHPNQSTNDDVGVLVGGQLCMGREHGAEVRSPENVAGVCLEELGIGRESVQPARVDVVEPSGAKFRGPERRPMLVQS